MANNSADSSKVTLWFIGGFLVLVIGAVIIAGATSGFSSGSSASSTFNVTYAPAITSADWTEGNPNAKVSVIEYGDFECPACGAYYPIVKQLVSDYGNQIYFAFRNFPLYTIHPDAGVAAQAAEAAGLQGQYWPMHDLLYQNQATWSNALASGVVGQYFDGYASSLGLNVAKFDADMNSNTVAAKIQNDVNSGNAASIDHTPTFFINLAQIPNPTSYDDFKAKIDAALGTASSTPSPSPVSVSVSGSVSSTLTVTSTPLKF